eukprot:927520-Pelagomonas_calceolata.AAC.1
MSWCCPFGLILLDLIAVDLTCIGAATAELASWHYSFTASPSHALLPLRGKVAMMESSWGPAQEGPTNSSSWDSCTRAQGLSWKYHLHDAPFFLDVIVQCPCLALTAMRAQLRLCPSFCACMVIQTNTMGTEPSSAFGRQSPSRCRTAPAHK